MESICNPLTDGVLRCSSDSSRKVRFWHTVLEVGRRNVRLVVVFNMARLLCAVVHYRSGNGGLGDFSRAPSNGHRFATFDSCRRLLTPIPARASRTTAHAI